MREGLFAIDEFLLGTVDRFHEKHYRDKEENTQDTHSLSQYIVVPKLYHYNDVSSAQSLWLIESFFYRFLQRYRKHT
jgi:hypothetical protein